MIQALLKLADYNTESIVAWSEKIGFTSLFTELMRLEEQSPQENEATLKQDMYSDLFHVNEEGALELTRNSIAYAPVYNLHGMVQVGDYVGVMSRGLNVWVKPEKESKLVAALYNRHIPEDDKDFILLYQDVFDNDKDWTQAESCPKNNDWVTPTRWYANPNANRRIGVRHELRRDESPNGDGTFSLTTIYWIYTESKKGANNRYRTSHYLSLDLRYTFVTDGVPGSITTRQETEIETNTKYAKMGVVIGANLNVPFNFWLNNYAELVETVPGTSGFNGTAASHRGMDGDYVRQDCD